MSSLLQIITGCCWRDLRIIESSPRHSLTNRLDSRADMAMVERQNNHRWACRETPRRGGGEMKEKALQ